MYKEKQRRIQTISRSRELRGGLRREVDLIHFHFFGEFIERKIFFLYTYIVLKVLFTLHNIPLLVFILENENKERKKEISNVYRFFAKLT